MDTVGSLRARQGLAAASLLSGALAVALALWAVAAAAAEVSGMVFVVKPAACVRGDKVLFGDIARPVGDLPADAWRQWAAIPLWAAPDRLGRTQMIPQAEIRFALDRALGAHAGAVSVPGSITVQRGGKVLAKDEIESWLTRQLAERLASLDAETTVRDLQGVQSVFLPEEFAHLELDPAQAFAPGRLTVRLLAKAVDGRVLRQIPVSVFIDCWKNVAVAARPLNPGERLTPAEVTFARKNLAYMKGEVWDGQLGEWRLRRPVGEGMVLYTEAIEALPLVRKGGRVTLEYRSQSFVLTASGEALSDGGFGHQILVRNLQSQKQVLATVKDATTVVVQ